MLACTWLVLCLSSASFAALLNLSRSVVSSLAGAPDGWIKIGIPDPGVFLHFRLAAHQPLMPAFHQRVIDIATPGHDDYGRHLSKDEIDAQLRPSHKTTAAITNWLLASGISPNSINEQGHWFTFNATVKNAEVLLGADFAYYQHNDDSSLRLVRTLQYSVPNDIRSHIDIIQPTTRFSQPQAQAKLVKESPDNDPNDFNDPNNTPPSPTPLDDWATGWNPDVCNSTITPDCIRGIYNMDDFNADPKFHTKLGISGFSDQVPRFDDIASFIQHFSRSQKDHDFSIVSVNGGSMDQHANGTAEANLDSEYAVTLARGTPVIYYSVGGRAPLAPDLDQPTGPGTNEPYLEQLHYLLGLEDADLPDVLSTSYSESEQSVPGEYAFQVCSLFAQLAARGVSVIFSAGDTGVGIACESNDGKHTVRFAPNFPASCPFVTSVGGTYGHSPEIAAAFSSGGFSNYFPRPSWQDFAVTAWQPFSVDDETNKGPYQLKGRAYPDVAAQSVRFAVWNKGVKTMIEGTSASAPVFAAIVSNLNNIRLAAGKSKLGFLNPLLYKSGHNGFTDIVDGHSLGCIGYDIFSGKPAPKIDGAKWSAGVGWDPITGWGTPDFAKLPKMVLDI